MDLDLCTDKVKDCNWNGDPSMEKIGLKMVGNGIHSIPVKGGGERNLIYAENKAKDSEDSAEWKCNQCRKQG